jgi:hypothetical protein
MNRYSYDVGISGSPTEGGYVMADSVKDAHETVDNELASLGVKESDIKHVIIEHVDNDDVMGRQFEKIEELEDAMKDLLIELGISQQDIKNRATSLSNQLSLRLIDLLEL